jgi:hypothetical protein
MLSAMRRPAGRACTDGVAGFAEESQGDAGTSAVAA